MNFHTSFLVFRRGGYGDEIAWDDDFCLCSGQMLEDFSGLFFSKNRLHKKEGIAVRVFGVSQKLAG